MDERKKAEKRVARKLQKGEYAKEENRERRWAESQMVKPVPPPKDSDTVPVRVDQKTVIYVAKSKCRQLADGTWIKQEEAA